MRPLPRKVLITGMTAAHCSQRTAARSASFSYLVSLMLERAGVEVTLDEPSMLASDVSLGAYDSIIVGVAPVTSTSATRAYGALHVLDVLDGDSRVRLLVDAPDPVKITHSLRAAADGSSLVKPFYSRRKDYEQAVKEKERLALVVQRLIARDWPSTLFPALPWGSGLKALDDQLPSAAQSAVSVCVDHEYARVFSSRYSKVQRDSRKMMAPWSPWVASLPTSRWTDRVSKGVSRNVEPLRSRKTQADVDAVTTMSKSFGLLLSPFDRSCWWSTSHLQAMHLGAPVVSDWRETSSIGSAWSLLAQSVEEMTAEEVDALVLAQREQYYAAIPVEQAALWALVDALTQPRKGDATTTSSEGLHGG